MLVLGVVELGMLGAETAAYAVLLAANVLLYDAVHKRTSLAPVIMAGCRLLLVLLAASSADGMGNEPDLAGADGLAVWSGLALFAYVIGLSFIARAESAPGVLRFWPCVLLAAPLVLAWVVNEPPWLQKSAAVALVLLVWVGRSLAFTFGSRPRQVGRTVSGLLAGIVLVDLLAVAGEPMPLALAFPLLFALSLLAQRHVPAT